MVLLQYHGVTMKERLAPTVVVRTCIKQDTQIGCLFALVRHNADWLFVPNNYADEVIEALESEGERVLIL